MSGNGSLHWPASQCVGGGTASYPSELYTGDHGEASAWIRRNEEPADLKYTNGGTVDYS